MALTPLYALRVTASVFQVLGLILTAFRIYFRLKIGRFWWEDAWAGISLLSGSIWMIAQWALVVKRRTISIQSVSPHYQPIDGLTSIVGSWTYAIGFTCIITAVRMSVLFSITRVIPESSHLRKFTHLCAAFFAACWVILMIEKILQSDCVADLILVVLPLRVLWKVRLPRRQRRMILSIFASSIILAFGALCHTLGQVLNIYIVMSAGINVEIALSLIVCNLLVVVTCTYRFLLHDNDSSSDTGDSTDTLADDDDDFTQPRTLHLTTIELDMSSDCQDTSGITPSETSQSGTSQSSWASQEAESSSSAIRT
ncbi:hypothetical protein BDN67DRAFT_983644 [Paxillus ammoniavirescens]|nr:hypothetical protein BDN67DRAFT_983644 [Paxillus ammoniavirescens]